MLLENEIIIKYRENNIDIIENILINKCSKIFKEYTKQNLLKILNKKNNFSDLDIIFTT